MSLKVTISDGKKGVRIIALAGRLDTATAAECTAKIRPVVESKDRQVIFDLAALDYISSMGLRVILAARKAVEDRKGRVVVANMQAPIAKVFDVADILPKTDLFNNLQEADAYLDAIQRQEKLSHMEYPE